jgi:RND family efflux transporter MFP subunit
MSLPRSLFALCLLLPALNGLAAGEPLHLQPAQIRSLGIETRVMGDNLEVRPSRLPARVVIPADQIRLVSAPVAGLIERLTVATGAWVKQGEVVANLSSPEALTLQRDAMEAQTQSLLLHQNLKRDIQLFSEGLIPESRLQATRAAAGQAEAHASEAHQHLAMAGMVGRGGGPLALTAPIDGVVLATEATLGQRVEAAAVIYRIAQLRPLWLEIQAPMEIFLGLAEGTPVRVANSDIEGKVIAIGPNIDPTSQTRLLRALIDEGSEHLTPGQSVEVEITPAAAKHQGLPATAVIRQGGRTYAFVQIASDDQGARFEARPVHVIGQSGEGVLVEGLQKGERVVLRGVSGLKAMMTGAGGE